MRFLRNEDGVALITALMFTMLSLGMIMTLLYYVIAGTKMSASQKRYRSALEASYGGSELVTKTIIPRLFNNYSAGKQSLIDQFPVDFGLTFASSGLGTKLSTSTAGWGSLSKTTDPKVAPDVTFTLPGQNASVNYKVYTKIVDTVTGVGLLDASGIDYLDGGIGVAGTSTTASTPRTPNIYSIEVQGEAAVNPTEKAGISILYAY